MDQNFEDTVEYIYSQDPRYKPEAYLFIMDALSFAQKKFKCETHVTSEQLLVGLREFSVAEFGPMALSVLRHWGITTTADIGNVVFNMVENRILSKTSEDKMDGFRDFYNFDEVLVSEYRRKLARQISRLRA